MLNAQGAKRLYLDRSAILFGIARGAHDPPGKRRMSTRITDYDYDLPADLIADRPLPQRDESRMMVLHRDSQSIEHRKFRDLAAFVEPGDLFVLNNTRVL